MTEHISMLLLDKPQVIDVHQRDVTFRTPEPIFGVDDEIQLRVDRHRDSNGFGSITLQFGNSKIEFNTDLTPGYEIVARCAAEMLLKAVDHGCYLAPAIPAAEGKS